MKEKKVAVITGGSSGIGLAIARKLDSDGFHVIIFDMQKPPENFECFLVDIRSDRQLKDAFSHISRIDILVNNAGIYFEKYLEDTTNEDLDRMVDINIKGTFLVTRNALPKLLDGGGCIVMISDCLGVVPELTSPLYCTTKAGLIMLTKCLAQQYADKGVRVNCVLPGPVDTPLLQGSFGSRTTQLRCAERVPMRRIGLPEDVANMVSFLVSCRAGFITGGSFPVDGGISSSSLYSLPIESGDPLQDKWSSALKTDEETLAILAAVRDINQCNEIAGRNRIYWYLREQGYEFSEYRIRKSIKRLSDEALISATHGRYGLSLTDRGLMILEMQRKK